MVTAPMVGVCSTHLTEDFVGSVFGDLETCASSESANGATGATISGITIDGDTRHRGR